MSRPRAGRRRVPARTRAAILRGWDEHTVAALARRYKLPVTTVQAIGHRAGKTKKRPGRPRKEAG